MPIAQPDFQSNGSAALSEALFDVLIIGAGVVGCAMARRFTLEGVKTAVVEKASDILDGASKANSAILHTGFDAPCGSLELRCVRDGYREYEEIRRDLGLVQETTGAFVVAWNEEQMARLESIVTQAQANDVPDVELINAQSLRSAEPNLSDQAVGAVHVKRESIIDPWSAPYVYLQQALDNGASVFTSCPVLGGEFDGKNWRIETGKGTLRARYVINCAGLYGDDVDRKMLNRASFQITPRKGQFVVFDKAAAPLINAVILPVPTDKTKGVVLFRTVFGNLVVGPTAEDQESRTDTSTDRDTLDALIADGVAKLPGLADMPVTAVYAGLRPATASKDYCIDPVPDKNWITVGGIRSTGLSASLGIARYVYGLYQEMGSTHQNLVNPKYPKAKILAQAGDRDWQSPNPGEIVCHCELVTKREIEAALSGPLKACSLGGLKRQTRATMGRCQGFYCSARLAELTAGCFIHPLSEGIARD